MTDAAAKGDEFLKKAEKKLKSWNPFGNKYEEALELLEKATIQFKLGKCWKEAVQAYKMLADVNIKLESKHDAAGSYVEAAKCAMKEDMKAASALLQQAVEMYKDMGKLNMAARQLKELAEVQEKQGFKEEAIAFYLQASDLFATENSSSESNKCKLKIAEFSAELGKYPEAIDLYEEVAKLSMENNLLKFSAKGYLLNAGICYLCYEKNSADDVLIKLDKYKDIDFTFNGSRECTLLETLADAFASRDEKKFATAVAEYDSISRLDAWKTSLLLRVKKRIQQETESGTGGGDFEDSDDGGVL